MASYWRPVAWVIAVRDAAPSVVTEGDTQAYREGREYSVASHAGRLEYFCWPSDTYRPSFRIAARDPKVSFERALFWVTGPEAIRMSSHTFANAATFTGPGGRYGLILPYWMIVIVTGVLPLAATIRAFSRRRRLLSTTSTSAHYNGLPNGSLDRRTI
jgi:hypothetical protein